MTAVGTTQYGPLRVQLDDGVARVVIDHPPRHLVDGEFLVGLRAMLDAFDASGPGAVVFSSADPDFFLMHGDVEILDEHPPGPHLPATEATQAAAWSPRPMRSAP